MALSIGFNAGELALAATDADNNLLTSLERIDALFQQGFKTEAVSSQFILVEALLLHYMLSRKGDGIIYNENIPLLIAKKKLTFGKVKDLLINNNALHDPQIEQCLKEYVAMRNDFAHQLVSGLMHFDLERCFALGISLIAQIRPHMVALIQRVMEEPEA